MGVQRVLRPFLGAWTTVNILEKKTWISLCNGCFPFSYLRIQIQCLRYPISCWYATQILTNVYIPIYSIHTKLISMNVYFGPVFSIIWMLLYVFLCIFKHVRFFLLLPSMWRVGFGGRQNHVEKIHFISKSVELNLKQDFSYAVIECVHYHKFAIQLLI